MDGNTIIWVFAAAAFVSVFGGWGHYIATIPGDRVPKVPQLMFVTQGAGLVLAGLSIVLAVQAGSKPVSSMVLSGFALFMGVFFFILYSQRKTPLGKLQVKVGAPMLAFSTLDSSGQSVNSDDWRGKRILLKFFRGFW